MSRVGNQGGYLFEKNRRKIFLVPYAKVISKEFNELSLKL
jgi:hypothetical protein